MKTVTRRQKLVFEKICERILAGDGSGHGSSYRAWLQLHRKNSSKVSNQVQGWVVPLGRIATYMSRGEYRTAMLLLWLGVADLREQYPIWPTTHPHPLEGAEFAPPNLGGVRGLLEIADEAGIQHGEEVGTNIPYIATIDLAATVIIDDTARLFLFALKPFATEDHTVPWRTAERLELERRYSKEIAAPYDLIYSGIVPDTLAANLDQWIVHSDLNEHQHLLPSVRPFIDEMNAYRNLSVRNSVSHAAEVCRINIGDAWVLYSHCAWHQHIDVDPRVEPLHSYPAPAGGQQFRQQLREKFFGWA